ncbi:hypothetical protein Tco_1338778 [Tanacetum coccineum]
MDENDDNLIHEISFSLGETLVLMEKFNFQDMLKAVERFKVTYMSVLPSLVVARAKSEVVMRYDLSSRSCYIVMSDSEDSTVTYMEVSSPFGGLSDIGSPGVDGPPVMPEDLYAYVVAAFQAPPSPEYMP